jgi:hypothetical protein
LNNDTNMYMVFPPLQDNQVVKFGRDPIYRTIVIMRNDHVVKNYIYSNCDLDLRSNDHKINKILPHAEGNREVKFGRDPIYRTIVIMRKRPIIKNYIHSIGDIDL